MSGSAWAVVVAAGEGKRMREGMPAQAPRKPFIELAGRAILLRTLDAVAACEDIAKTVVAVAPADVAVAEELIGPEREQLRVAAVVAGGARRQ
ncbi:MAG: 2-C-methyl-D-erythritol 4-phosphate cytidylyltransferase, partial [Planctomycetota bacterium]